MIARELMQAHHIKLVHGSNQEINRAFDNTPPEYRVEEMPATEQLANDQGKSHRSPETSEFRSVPPQKLRGA